MECSKIIEVYPGVIQFQSCSCSDCLAKKEATNEFYKKFDAAYEQFQLNKGAPERANQPFRS
ncbi:hypothetical protein HPK19_19285 [Arthrobacter citreus]|nr:hypothetical protein HPK19_19285 [Arthrobacter citreus]